MPYSLSSVCRLFCQWSTSHSVGRSFSGSMSDLRRLSARTISSASISAGPYRSYKDAPNYDVYRNSGFVAERLEEIAESVTFEHWGEFRSLAKNAKRECGTLTLEQQEFVSKRFTSEDFEYDAPEAFDLLTKVAGRDEMGMSNAQILVREPVLTYGPGGGSHRVLHGIGIYTGSTLMPPDTGVWVTEEWLNGGDLLPPDAGSSSVASAYNCYFRSYREQNEEKGIGADSDCLLNQVSELILIALHTRSGWYCLQRQDEAVFVQVEPEQGSGRRWLTVRVSDIYRHDSGVCIVDGLRAMYAACKVADDTKLKRLGDIATRLIGCTAHEYGRSFPSTRLGNKAEDEATDEATDESTDESTDEVVDGLSLTKGEREMLKRAENGDVLLELNPGDLGRFFLVNCCGDLGCGSSGYVVQCCVGGSKFVVKRWNQYEWDIMNAEDGLLDLEYEIEIYAYLHMYHPEVLGRILPRPIAVCRENSLFWKPALVLTMVGEHIVRKRLHPANQDDSKEEWFVNGEQLSNEDILEIRRGAEENKKELKALGVEDNDVKGFNTRVEKVKDERGESKWHVWTIDLGMSRVFRDQEKSLDIEALRSLVNDSFL